MFSQSDCQNRRNLLFTSHSPSSWTVRPAKGRKFTAQQKVNLDTAGQAALWGKVALMSSSVSDLDKDLGTTVQRLPPAHVLTSVLSPPNKAPHKQRCPGHAGQQADASGSPSTVCIRVLWNEQGPALLGRILCGKILHSHPLTSFRIENPQLHSVAVPLPGVLAASLRCPPGSTQVPAHHCGPDTMELSSETTRSSPWVLGSYKAFILFIHLSQWINGGSTPPPPSIGPLYCIYFFDCFFFLSFLLSCGLLCGSF